MRPRRQTHPVPTAVSESDKQRGFSLKCFFDRAWFGPAIHLAQPRNLWAARLAGGRRQGALIGAGAGAVGGAVANKAREHHDIKKREHREQDYRYYDGRR